MTADERINALLERAGCPVMVVKDIEDADCLGFLLAALRVIDTPMYGGSLCKFMKHLVDTIDQLEVALENALNERDHRLNTLRDAIYEDAVAHGLWDDMDNYIGVHVVVEEVKELIDAAADLSAAKYSGEDLEQYRQHFIEELADVVISSLSLAGRQKVDIDAAVRQKMEINKGRPWRHENEGGI